MLKDSLGIGRVYTRLGGLKYSGSCIAEGTE